MRDISLATERRKWGQGRLYGRCRVEMGHGRQVQGRYVSYRVTAACCSIRRTQK